MHIIRLCVLVWEVGAGGHVDQERLSFSAWCRRRPFRHRQEVHQLVTEFDRGADQRGTVGRVETRSASFLMHHLKFTPGA